MPVDGGYFVGAAGVLTALGAAYSQWRDSRRHDRIDPVSLVTDANKAAYDALQGTITRLEHTVDHLSQKLESTERALDRTNIKLNDVQRDLNKAVEENAALRRKVGVLVQSITDLGGVPPRL